MYATLQYFFYFFILLATGNLVAQDNFIDYNPQCRTWADDYQLDRIEFTETNTIFHLRFIKNNNKYVPPTFYPPKQEYSWVLETNDNKYYHFTRLTNITKNGVVEVDELGATSQTISALTKGKSRQTVFTCQLYFPRLPSDLDSISLIEGKNYKNTRTHLNFFNIQLKNENRGNETSEKERILALGTPKEVVTTLDLGTNNYPYIDQLDDYKEIAVLDQKPSYKTKDPNYILDNIVYTKTEIIFSLRIIFKDNKNSNIIIYPVGGEHPWILIDKKNKTTYPVKMISNFCKNGLLIHEKIGDSQVNIKALNYKMVTFTCRVHFDRTPENIETLDLIEGVGEEKNKNHFNYFNVKIKDSLYPK